MLRFVVLFHDWPAYHYDLMLQAGATLKTWRLAAKPLSQPVIAAEPSFEHRLKYLDYEGPVSGDRGHVDRWDSGELVWIANEPTRVVVELNGQKLRGRFVIANGYFSPAPPSSPAASGPQS